MGVRGDARINKSRPQRHITARKRTEASISTPTTLASAGTEDAAAAKEATRERKAITALQDAARRCATADPKATIIEEHIHVTIVKLGRGRGGNKGIYPMKNEKVGPTKKIARTEVGRRF